MGKFVIRCTATGCKFDLVAANGEVIASSEVYASAAACKKGIQGVVKAAPSAPMAEPERQARLPANPRFELFTDKAGQFRFRLRSRNGKVIAASQGYSTRGACETGIESVRKNVQDGALEIL